MREALSDSRRYKLRQPNNNPPLLQANITSVVTCEQTYGHKLTAFNPILYIISHYCSCPPIYCPLKESLIIKYIKGKF
jgi:hypothetical protein